MPKITLFLLKNRKNCPTLGAMPCFHPLDLPQTPMPLSGGDYAPRPPHLPYLNQYEFFAALVIITAAFTWHKEKDGNITKLVPKRAAAAAVTDINLLQIMTSYITYDILKPSVLRKIWKRGGAGP